MSRYTSLSPSTAPRSQSPSPSHSPRSPSPSPKPRHRHSPPSSDRLGKDTAKDALKTSLVFLGAVGAVSLVAHKFWPKGTLYGEKESWAHEAKDKVKRAVHRDPKDDRDYRRSRPRSAYGDDRRRKPDLYLENAHKRRPRVDVEEEEFGARPAYRRTHSNDDGERYSDGSLSHRSRWGGDDGYRDDRYSRLEDERASPRDGRGQAVVERPAPRPRVYIEDGDAFEGHTS
ncbi:hypothetical protein F5B20DRAFT_516036 [Whalleya microplaca]|nr:hypothetical protein F5B20DRAFT_516036 [Whalleya microplaca]